jgi:hypothetical protein
VRQREDLTRINHDHNDDADCSEEIQPFRFGKSALWFK